MVNSLPWNAVAAIDEGANFGDVDYVDVPDGYNLVINHISLLFEAAMAAASFSLTIRDTVANSGSGTIPIIAIVDHCLSVPRQG